MKFPKRIKGLEKNVFEPIDYKNLMDMFSNLKCGMVIMGNIKDKHTCIILDVLNKCAIKKNINKIYFYDCSYENKLGKLEDIRSCSFLEEKMDYYALVEKLGFKSDTLVKDTLIPQIEVPLIFGIRYGACTGFINPIYNKWQNRYFIPGKKEDMTVDLIYSIFDLIDKTDISDDKLL